jgi:N-acetylglucosamine kinase-like BadF-type ATPase
MMARAGGWGYLLGDEGSGYDIGLTALRCVARASDGRGPQTMLTELILAHWSLRSANDLIGYVYRPQVSETGIAALAVLVESAARQGDPVAQNILQQAGRELAMAVQVVSRRLQLPEPTPCALAGGMMVRGELISQEFLAAAGVLNLQLFPVQRVSEPAIGAIRLAAERASQA